MEESPKVKPALELESLKSRSSKVMMMGVELITGAHNATQRREFTALIEEHTRCVQNKERKSSASKDLW